MFVWFSYPEKTWGATNNPRLNDVGKFSMFKINLSYFPSRARLNFRWIFKEFDLKSNMKGFFENFLALSVKKLKKVLMILPSITGRGRAFLAESCRYMPCLAIRRWNFPAKVANPKVNSQKVYHDDRSTLVGECCKLPIKGIEWHSCWRPLCWLYFWKLPNPALYSRITIWWKC